MIARPSYFAAVLDEVESLAQTSQQVRGTGDLGETPLVVLTAGQALPAEALEQMELTIDQIQPIWMEMQEELVTLSTNSTHRIVPDSGHHIHLDRPDMVVDAIRSVFDIVSGER